MAVKCACSRTVLTVGNYRQVRDEVSNKQVGLGEAAIWLILLNKLT